LAGRCLPGAAIYPALLFTKRSVRAIQ
jgi:hypothetical protein